MGDFTEGPDRVDGKLKVTGAAKYSAEYDLEGLCYGVLVGSTIPKGSIKSIESKKAERAPGVLSVISHLNSPKVPGDQEPPKPSKGPTLAQPLRVFFDATIYFYDQPVALVVADSLERAIYAASLVQVQYDKTVHLTDMDASMNRAAAPSNAGRAKYLRGEANAYKNAEVKIEQEYVIPREVHNPMELHSIIGKWEGDDKVMLYAKTQGVKSTQQAIMQAFKLPESNVQVNAKFVGGGFGSALRTWPHVIAALLGAKVVKKPLKLVLSRDQMFTMSGFRPYTWQKIGLGATREGKLTGITHEAVAETSSYEEFTENTTGISRSLYACPNVNTAHSIVPLDVSTPTWMRGPGEASGAFALECAIDELSYALDLDPIELRLRNYAETDPEKNLPFSSKFLKECYEKGAERIGWNKRDRKLRSMKQGDWLVGYGMSTGTFGAFRGRASVNGKLMADGTLLLQSAVSDSGPGTATSMTALASELLGIPASKITFELGDSSLPPGNTQGGSTTTSTLGSSVYGVVEDLKLKLSELAVKEGMPFANAKTTDLIFKDGTISITSNPSAAVSYSDLLKKSNTPEIFVTKSSQPASDSGQYSMYSFSVHFVEVHVHPATGVVRIHRAVSVADAGKIVSYKTAENQSIGGVVGGIGMALMEDAVFDHKLGRNINNNFADYHVPVHADIPLIEAIFINKPDPHTNPMGSKGLGEIALVGFAAAVANAVYHATGKRIRELPITPDKLI